MPTSRSAASIRKRFPAARWRSMPRAPNISIADLSVADHTRLTVEIGTQRIAGISRAYQDRATGELLAVIGSSDMLEIAICCGHAGEILAVWSGDKVVVRGLSP
jgi:S-adenosylmethionine hydrolase